jgi:glucan 1,3-beta-glucosidase
MIELQLAQCPPTTTIVDGCVAAAMILHITPQANGYFENMWAWVADHDIDDADNKQVTVAVGRGILVESEAGPTWFYGTASEHSMLYQYNFYQTANVFAGMIQTESPYFQYADSSESPGPFSPSVGLFNNDPDFSSDDTCNGTAIGCDISWAVIFSGTDNVTIAGAGLYSWFDAYDQSVCVDAQNCQQRLIMDNGDNGGFYLWNLVTIGSAEMISNTYTDNSIYAKDNTQATSHPFWSSLGAYMDSTDPEIETCSDEDLSDECRWDNECDFTLSFATLDALQAASGSMPDICLPYYALGLLQSNLTQSLSDYESVNDGYDDVFDDYADYVKDMIPEILSDFMADSSPSNPSGGDGNQYFDCTFESGTLKETQQCPWGYMQIVSYDVWTITYNIKDENGFYNALSSKYGIVKDWVTLGGHWEQKNSCAGNSKFCARTDYEKVNIPQASGNITVPNPKDVITNALPNIGNLKTSLLSRQVDSKSLHIIIIAHANPTNQPPASIVSLGTWDGPIDDVIQVLSVPVFMINQALQSMISAKAAGQQAAKEKKIQTILLILGIVFMFVPFLDEVLPEVEALGVSAKFRFSFLESAPTEKEKGRNGVA